MARTVEQALKELRSLDPSAPETIASYRKALAASRAGTGVVIEWIAKRASEHQLTAIADDLATAFGGLLGHAKRDPQCRGKTAVARALCELECWHSDVFVGGLRVVQREGYEQHDTAAELRALCGLAHARFGRPDALDVLAELLTDPERNAREGAARGIGDAGHPEGTALLRYFLLASNEREPTVLAAACESLLALAREASTPFLVGLLANDDQRSEAAALALGAARVGSAFDALCEWIQRTPPERRRRVGYLSVALLRSDRATDYLLGEIRDRAKPDAVAAASALATFRAEVAIAVALRDLATQLDHDKAREILALVGG